MSSKIARGKLLRISSEDKQVGESNSNFSIILNNSPYVQNVGGVVVKSVSFKHVFPNIFEGNRYFTFDYNAGTIITVDLESAWYDGTTLAVALALAINADPAVLNLITVSLDIVPIGASSKHKKMVFTASGGDTIKLLDKAMNTMADVLGITEDTNDAVSQTAQALPDLGGLSVIYLCSQDVANNNSTASSNGGETIPVVTEIPIYDGFGEQINYRSNDDSLD